MFFFTFLAHPRPTHSQYCAVDGAYVACWVAEPIESAAELLAREAIGALDWDVEERDEAYPVSIDDYETETSLPGGRLSHPNLLQLSRARFKVIIAVRRL